MYGYNKNHDDDGGEDEDGDDEKFSLQMNRS